MQALTPLIVTLSLVSGAQLKLLPYAYLASPFPVYHQYQNTRTGEHAYSYAGGPSAKEEIKDADGVTRGSYSYVDANGILQSVFYVADENGFRVAATDLPSDGNLNLEASHVLLARSVDANRESSSRRKRSVSDSPARSNQDEKLERGVTVDALPLIPSSNVFLAGGVPLASSSQSQVQIHRNAQIQLPTNLAIQDQQINVLKSVPVLTTLPSYHENRIELHKQLGIEGLRLKDAVKIDQEPATIVQSPGAIPLVPVLAKQVPILSNLVPASLGSASVTTSVSSHGIDQIHPSKVLQESLIIPSVLAKEAAPVAVEKKTVVAPVAVKEALPIVREAVPVSLGTATSSASITSYGVSQIHGDSRVNVEPTLLVKATPIAHLQPLLHYPLYLH
ncbi:uncharacterized protein LOC122405119 [Colletes gigas]|uniref:uncharacterized protein LOC122405119 n=1 Tax=Colletes gigas TaxID=935657 RepID=UPI001C9A6D82|nr:uncharacterized protein LOC122405119 [Colletes gigas]